MPDQHSESQPPPEPQRAMVRWGYLGIAVAIIGLFLWVHANKDRAQRNLTVLCTEEYGQAHTAADTTAIDRRIIVPMGRRGTAGVTCRQYRRG